MSAMAAASIVQRGAAAITWRLTPWDADGLGRGRRRSSWSTATMARLRRAGGGAGRARRRPAAAATRRWSPRGSRPSGPRPWRRWPSPAGRAVETSHALTLDLAAWSPPPSLRRAVAVEPATAADAPALAELAATAFDYSRFHEDPRIHPARARGRYRRWIVDSLSNGDEVWVHRRAGQVAALMSFRRVAPTQVELRLGGVAVGLGPLASMFWVGVLRGLAAQGVAAIATRVSAANAGALRLHDALGFARGPIAIGATKLYAPSLVAAPPPRTAVRT
jgi:hypothetical protein